MQAEETRVALVNPDADPRVLELYQKGEELKAFAESFMVESVGDMREAADTLSLIKGLTNAIEVKRGEYVRPLNEHVKAINASFKIFVAPMEEADKTLRAKVVAHQKEQERIQAEQESINRLREEAAQRDMELNQELSEPVNLVPVQEAPQTVRSSFTTLSKTTTWKWELEDLSKVPLEYLVIDSSKVGKVVRAGTRNIPGVRIYPDQGISVAPKREAVPQPPIVAPVHQEALEDLPF